MKIREMINALIELEKTDPEAILCVTEDGYYSVDRYDAEIFFPSKERGKGKEHLYSIGHSSQTN